MNQTTPPPLLPSTIKQVLETHEPSLFQPSRSQLNHHMNLVCSNLVVPS